VQNGQKDIVECVAHSERSVLGCLAEFCFRGSPKQLDDLIASGLSDQFVTSDCSRIFRAMVELRNEGKIPDSLSMGATLDDRLMAQVCELTVGIVPENLEPNVRDLHEARRDYRFLKQQ
jgi:hypothetical protein